MKKRIFKSSVFLLTFMTLALICAFSSSAGKYVDHGDFTYYLEGEYAQIAAYNGDAESLTIPAKVGKYYIISIGKEAFWAKKNLKSISLPSTLKSIGKAAFNECTGLTKVVLPSKLKTIGDAAFWYCTGLKQMYIPPSVTTIGTNAFKGCNNLTAYVIKNTYAESYIKNQNTVKLGYRYASSIKLAATSATVYVGRKCQFKYAVYPTNSYNKKVAFTSSDPTVLEITKSGYLTAKKCGTVTVTCQALDGSKVTAKATIKVVPAKVTALSQSKVSTTGFTLKWNKAAGAEGYGVYLYENKKWVLKSKTSGTTFTVTGLKPGTTLKYGIVPYAVVNKKYYKGSAAYIEATVLSPGVATNVTYKSTESTVTLSWDKASNATGYRVYSYNESTKKYTHLGNTTKLTATLKNLKPNSKQLYSIRAYLSYNGTTILADKYVDKFVAYTSPDKVKGLSFDKSSLTPTSVRLTWNKLSDCSGYELYSYDAKAENKYTLIAKLSHPGITGFTVDSLKAATSYSYAIRSYTIRGKQTLYSSYSSPLTLSTSAGLPANHTEAFNGFITALNTTKQTTEDFYLIEATEVSNLNGNGSESCESILKNIGENSVSKRYFKGGTETETNLNLGNYIYPLNKPAALKQSQIKSTEYKLDGDAYTVTITLKEETNTSSAEPAVNKEIAPVIDWGVIAGQNAGFVFESCLYEGTTIEAKIRGGKIEYITYTMPVSFTFNYGGTKYTFAETLTHSYIFSW